MRHLRTIASIAAAAGLLLFAGTAAANPSIFVAGKSTAVATTTIAYMTPGTATTTLSYDSFLNGKQRDDAPVLLLQFTASSTSSTLLVNQEFSQDGVDWYQGSPTTPDSAATSSIPQILSVVPQYQWTYASSTPGLGAVGNASRDSRAVPLRSPTRFTRIIFSMKAGGTNGGVWASIVPARQAP